MATAPTPGNDENEKRREFFSAPIAFRLDSRDLSMTIGDVTGNDEKDCTLSGGVSAVAAIGMIAQGQVALNVVASLWFYALRQSGDQSTKFSSLLGRITYNTTLEMIQSAELPEVDDDAEADPTNGA